VQLPLAEADSLDGVELGSRHRAAIGITIGSDATCLVVSEETGIISIAENGKLTRNVNESQLRKHLTGVLGRMAGPTLAGASDRLRGHSNKTMQQKKNTTGK